MVNNTLTIILVVGSITIIFILFTTLLPIKSPVNMILDKLNILTGCYITLSVCISYILFNERVTEIKVNTTLKATDSAWIVVNGKFIEYYDKCPHFVNSLYFDWQKKYILTDEQKKENKDDWVAINYLCIIIFQACNYSLTVNELDDNDEEAWIGAFLNWIASPILRKYWQVMRNNYSILAQRFIDLLIVNYEKYPCKNADECHKLIKYIHNSKEYKDINIEIVKNR
jgi:hypothetical protein